MRIITHGSSSHRDDFLSVCLALAALERGPIRFPGLEGTPGPIPVDRREPTPAELADPKTIIFDIGGQHDPALRNFDHHQLPADGDPACALTLLLQHLGIHEAARAAGDWVDDTALLDCRGPYTAGAALGMSGLTYLRLDSPVELAMRADFAQHQTLPPDHPLHQTMRRIGHTILEGILAYQDHFAAFREQITLEAGPGESAVLLALTVDRAYPDRFISAIEQETGKTICAHIEPDKRGTGYALSRHADHQQIDFRRLSNDPRMGFIHNTGFMATTRDPLDQAELLALVMTAANAAG